LKSSRRARLILVLLLLTAVTLVALDTAGGASFGGLRTATGAVFGPIETAVGGIAHPIGDFFSGLGGGSSDQVAALRKKNAGCDTSSPRRPAPAASSPISTG
jgi:hypothetical protein